MLDQEINVKILSTNPQVVLAADEGKSFSISSSSFLTRVMRDAIEVTFPDVIGNFKGVEPVSSVMPVGKFGAW